jgi:hypothetical protein
VDFGEMAFAGFRRSRKASSRRRRRVEVPLFNRQEIALTQNCHTTDKGHGVGDWSPAPLFCPVILVPERATPSPGLLTAQWSNSRSPP